MNNDINLWYLAHPVAGDERFTIEQNLEHTCKILRLCHTVGLYAVAPWYGMVEAYKQWRGTKAYAAFREMGLNMDEENVRAYGRIILTGHMVSPGMLRELNAFRSLPSAYAGGRVIDATNIPDHQLTAYLQETRRTLIDAGLLRA